MNADKKIDELCAPIKGIQIAMFTTRRRNWKVAGVLVGRVGASLR